MTHLELHVDGMTCGGCSGRLNRVLRGREGIAGAEADHVGNRVSVDFDPTRIDAAQIRQAISDAGFVVKPD
ncbi:heavy-metal-associated domain-containing protein [Frateuria aurantia]